MDKNQKCILCNSDNTILQWKNVRGYRVRKCLDCSFLFLDEIKSEQELEEFYSENYFMASYARNETDLVSAAKKQTILSEAAEYAKLIRNYNPQAVSVVEIGCSWGYLLYNLQNFEYSVKGYELSKTTANAGREQLGLDITSGFFEAQIDQFDVLILRHVLEHVPDPQDILSKIYDSLTKGGLFILEGPNLDSISSKLFGQNVSWVAPPEHVSFPNFRSLVIAGEKLGFKCIYKSTRRGRGISIFHQALLNSVGLFFGGKENAKNNLGGINDNASNPNINKLKKFVLKAVSFLDFLSSPIHPFLRQALLEEEMLIVFKK